MAIRISKYVNIVSGIGAGNVVRQRDLVGRLFDDNSKIPVGTLLEMDTTADVGDYFGTTSPEYQRAQFYFSFISKNITRPEKIQFARFPGSNQPPRIYGNRITATVAQFKEVLAGTLSLVVGGTAANLAALDFSEDNSFSEVANTITAALAALADAPAQIKQATVSFDAPTSAFLFQGGVAEDADVSVTRGGEGDISSLLGWTVDAIYSPGVLARSAVDTLEDSLDQSTNFGSFLFMQAMSTEDKLTVAKWNDDRNVEFLFCTRCNDDDRVALSAALLSVNGTALTYAPDESEYDEMCPMMVMAATDYTRQDSVQNYMFQVFDGLTPKVTKTQLSNTLDAARINYYGQTQTAGQNLSFYQRGVLGGGQLDPVDMNVYANEMWLKDAARANLMTLLLTSARVSVDAGGRGQVIANLQDVVNRALNNGTIAVDKPLTAIQKAYITRETGDGLAWHQVQGTGYWLDAEMSSEITTDGRTEWKCDYRLIYAKDDAIRSVDGTHTLI